MSFGNGNSGALLRGGVCSGWFDLVEKRFSPRSRIARGSGEGRAKRGRPAPLISRIDRSVRFCVRFFVKSISVTQARSRLYELLDLAAASHEPVQITGKRSNAVLISEDDWSSMQESLFLLSVPGMRESIREGLNEPLDQSFDSPGW